MTDLVNEPRWLTDEQQHAWRTWLLSGLNAIDNIDQDLIDDTGIDLLTYHIIVQASENPGIRVGALASSVLASKQRIGQRVKALTAEGLLTTGTCSDDARAKNVTATKAGIAVLERAAPGHVESVRNRVIDILTDEEIRTLGVISKKILDNQVKSPIADSKE
jgi:DNA-binding MarR family transcriptional regulator